MTLILNQVKFKSNYGDSYWICAADRRLSTYGAFHSTSRKKIFPVKYINATVSYFGLAVWKYSNKEVYFSDILKNEITKLYKSKDLDDFAINLIESLNKKLPINILKDTPTGIHISGFNKDGIPCFLYSSNIGKINSSYHYENIKDKLSIPSNHLDRDLRNHYNWDGNSFNTLSGKGFLYRNGDIRSHVISSEKLDDVLNEIFKSDDFKSIIDYKSHADYVNFKFNFIAYLYKTWSKKESIGKPIDVYIVFKDKILENKNGNWQILS